MKFTSFLLSQGFTYCHYTLDEVGQCLENLKSTLDDLLQWRRYGAACSKIYWLIPTTLLLLRYYHSINSLSIFLTWIYEQGMACPFQLFMVPYHFSIQPEKSPTLQQWKRLSRIWVGNSWKSCWRQSTPRPQKKITSPLAHYLPYLHYLPCMSGYNFLIYILLHRSNEVTMPLDETEIHQQMAKFQKCIQRKRYRRLLQRVTNRGYSLNQRSRPCWWR